MKHIKLFESFINSLNEKAIPFDDILNDKTQIGLVVDEKTRNGQKKIFLCLYDFDDKKVMAYLYMKATGSNSETFEIQNTVAEKDYGPDIYDLGLMFVYPNGVKQDIMIKPEAQKIWKFYNEKRPDVKKVKIDSKDSDYVDRYETDLESGYNNDKDILNLINTKFSKEKDKSLTLLLDKGKEYLTKYNLKVNQVMKFADDAFKSRYYKD